MLFIISLIEPYNADKEKRVKEYHSRKSFESGTTSKNDSVSD